MLYVLVQLLWVSRIGNQLKPALIKVTIVGMIFEYSVQKSRGLEESQSCMLYDLRRDCHRELANPDNLFFLLLVSQLSAPTSFFCQGKLVVSASCFSAFMVEDDYPTMSKLHVSHHQSCTGLIFSAFHSPNPESLTDQSSQVGPDGNP